ncbi:ribonuclease H [Clostridium cellulovorans]|uniref:Ribonuclease H n=1 Tax=Clostridium cellulovorans (strain ATCC 35296 / DSM 3052 / OCM 3 / 743B) TaxID=573061 RepID=D9SUA9_CLOC7|nr:ribonuclease H [Clostridium cellulovorans]ADL52864.1 ribonuclease H [Clostridium cellulovorans 743B]
MKIYVDGGVKCGEMYISVYSNSPQFPIKFSRFLGQGHIHEAEEEALYHCTKILSETANELTEDITIYSDQVALVNTINRKNISTKASKTFPKAKEIQNFCEDKNITLQWVPGKRNIAHTLIMEAYEGMFYDETILETSYDNSVYIAALKKELLKKDELIRALLKFCMPLF